MYITNKKNTNRPEQTFEKGSGGDNQQFGELEIQIAHMIGFMEAQGKLNRYTEWQEMYEAILEIGHRWYGEYGYEIPAGYIDVMDFAKDLVMDRWGITADKNI